MFELNVTGDFSAAHNLRGYQGKCEDIHGHNWKVQITICGDNLGKTGMLMDFKDFRLQLNKVIYKLDHKHLNHLNYFSKVNPTSENIAKYIYDNLKKKVSGLKSVRVWESDNCSAAYYEK